MVSTPMKIILKHFFFKNQNYAYSELVLLGECFKNFYKTTPLFMFMSGQIKSKMVLWPNKPLELQM